MGKITVAEASDAIPVRTTVPEELGKAEEIRSSEMTISSAISDRISQNHSRNQIQQWTMRVTPSPEKLSPQLTIGLRISSEKSKNSTHLWNIIVICFFILSRGLNRQYFGQISAQNLSKILNVWVKVWTKQTQKERNPDKTRYAKKVRKCDLSAHVTPKARNYHISLPCVTSCDKIMYICPLEA